MAMDLKVAAFEGGSLRTISVGKPSSSEAVLALPINRLLVKMVRIPEEMRENPVEAIRGELQAISPFPDEALTISLETVRETERGLVAIAAALPESSADDIAEALDAAKLNVTRVDLMAIGTLRALWSGISSSARKVVIIRAVDSLTIIVLDGDEPLSIRAVLPASDLKREIMLSLIEAEDFGGERNLEKIYVASSAAVMGEIEVDTASLATIAPVEELSIADEDAALHGVAERSFEEGTLNALPDTWREVLEETRFKRTLNKYLGAFGALWIMIMAVLIGLPFVFGFMTDHQKSLSKAHQKQYRSVLAMKEKVNLVRKYSDHDRGALEIMKAISDRLPQGIELNSWNFKREEEGRVDTGLKISGEATDASLIYKFKDAVIEMDVFPEVNLNGPSAGKNGRQRFDLDCKFVEMEDR